MTLVARPPRGRGRPSKASLEIEAKKEAQASNRFGPDDEFLTTVQAAKLTGMSVAWYERKRWERKGPPFIKKGRSIRYVRSALVTWWMTSG